MGAITADRKARWLAVALGLVLLLAAVQAAWAQFREAGQGGAVVERLQTAERAGGPLGARVGVEVRQIVGVDQKAENFTAVVRIRMAWQSPDLVFDPGSEGTALKVMDGPAFLDWARRAGIVAPGYTVENQQARAFVKESLVAWTPDGEAMHAAEATLTLQAPDFDFTRFPFDRQTFFVRIVANAPETLVRLVADETASGLGDRLGEEEWRVLRDWTEVDTVTGLTGVDSSRYSLAFEANRHMLYYWARVFFPMFLLIGVSWANLFLEDYRRRIDIAGANLLAFIAFNFTISGELPRLGYLTFLDATLLAMFVLSAATVAYNVLLQRMAISGQEARARQIDWHVTYWGYPAMYLFTVAATWIRFFG